MSDHEQLADEREREADKLAQENERIEAEVEEAKAKVEHMHDEPLGSSGMGRSGGSGGSD